MKYCKEDILKVAFNEFMMNGYESSIISSLQKELGMSKGGLYRHFKSKDELFKSVIDHYFFNMLDRLIYKSAIDTTFLEKVDIMYRRQKLVQALLFRHGSTPILFVNYFNLLIQAAKYYPGFINRFEKIRSFIESAWRISLNKSIAQGEIRNDVDVSAISKLCTQICLTNNGYEETPHTSIVPNSDSNIEEQKTLLLAVYELMKI